MQALHQTWDLELHVCVGINLQKVAEYGVLCNPEFLPQPVPPFRVSGFGALKPEAESLNSEVSIFRAHQSVKLGARDEGHRSLESPNPKGRAPSAESSQLCTRMQRCWRIRRAIPDLRRQRVHLHIFPKYASRIYKRG